MKRFKIISAVLAVAVLITSLNLGMMFTSNAATVGSIDGIITAVNNAKNNGTTELTINIENDIDCSGNGPYTPIDASGIKITFKGAEHVISNLNLNGGGLFTKVGEGSIFKNIAFYNCYVYDYDATDKGYGMLCDDLENGEILNVIVAGKMAIYGSGDENEKTGIGGLVGYLSGDSTSVTNSFSMVDIHTDRSYVGGLVGRYVGSANDITKIMNCYSTGTIDNGTREKFTKDYIGGLIGHSNVSCVSSSYTTMFITAPYADTVKAIGCIPDLASTVYYDDGISLQRQKDLDKDHRLNAVELQNRSITGFKPQSGYYPQLSVFYESSADAFKRLSAISAAVVDVNLGTGREYAYLSETTEYNYATITKDNLGTGANQFDWQITGGVDEYYFDPDTSHSPGYGAPVNGLSGNTYDVNNGKYLFVTEGDVVFTAKSDIFSRDITVHVLERADSPYFADGYGTEDSPFIINSVKEFDLIRLYCLDDEGGGDSYYYTLNTDLKMTDFAETWVPIVGMKGTLIGNSHKISDLIVNKANEGGAGLFATVSATADISDLYITNAQITVQPLYPSDTAGVLAGLVKDAKITNVFLSGTVSGTKNGGAVAGSAQGETQISLISVMGQVTGTENLGGVFGTSESTVTITDCYSTAVVYGGQNVAGIFADGAGTVTNCLFTGMVSPKLGGKKYGLCGGSPVVTASYFDTQSTGISDTTNGRTTSQLTDSSFSMGSNWTHADGKYPEVTLNGNMSALTDKASALSILPVVYEYMYDPATSISFDTATISDVYYDSLTFDTPTATVNANTGYSISDNYKFVTGTGGLQIYALADEDQFSDVRYLLFNVKNLKIYYKFVYADDDHKTEYDVNDMKRGLAGFVTEFKHDFSAILDSSVTDYTGFITIKPATDTLTASMTMPYKYNDYSFKVYNSADTETRKEITVTENTFSVAGLESVYIDIIINEKTLPWGIYNIDCN